MADKKVKFLLDLDVKEFTEKGLQAKGVVQGLSEEKNLSGLIDGLTKATAVLGTVSVAAYAFKKAIDLTLEAEQIKRIEDQFSNLASQAGISAKELKSGMEDAAKGLVTTGDLLEVANKSIVTMGASAKRLPEVLTLARKATQIYGGDVKTNFERLTQAINQGETGLLKQYGILIDIPKAVQEYARANGIAANELSETARRQAIMNQALEQGDKNFKNVSEDFQDTQSTLTLLKNTISETAEVLILFFDKKFGPTIRNFLFGIKDMAAQARQALTSMFGEGLEQNNAQIAETEAKLMSLKGELIDLEVMGEGEGFFAKLFKGKKEDRIIQINAEIAKTTQALEALRAKNAELRNEEAQTSGGPQAPDNLVNQEIRLANEKKFQQAMIQIQKESLVAQQLNVQSFNDIEKALKDQQLIDEDLHQQKIQEIRSTTMFNETQKTNLIDAENKRFMASAAAREMQLADTRKKLLDQYQKNSKSAFNGIARAFQVTAAKQNAELRDWGKQGQQVVNSFQANSTIAFTKFGEAAIQGQNLAEAAAKAAGAAILGTIGDKAIADGSYMMLSGIWPPNPVAIGAGAGLIALGGSLKAVSSGMLGSMSPSGAGGGGGMGAMQDPCPAIAKAKTCAGLPEEPEVTPLPLESGSMLMEPDMEQMERRQRAVNISIAGNYFDTDTTRRQLMEMIRQETDATDFSYNKIGVG